nr:MAG TPA: hypothetical protein [Caudoviricetes sp.]
MDRDKGIWKIQNCNRLYHHDYCMTGAYVKVPSILCERCCCLKTK